MQLWGMEMVDDECGDGAARPPTDHVARIGPLRTETVLAAARRGAAAPTDLAPEDVQAVCRVLLIQFAQMGIG